MTNAKREAAADRLSAEAADWIISQLDGTLEATFNRRSQLENDIYAWLLDYAVFPGEDAWALMQQKRVGGA